LSFTKLQTSNAREFLGDVKIKVQFAVEEVEDRKYNSSLKDRLTILGMFSIHSILFRLIIL